MMSENLSIGWRETILGELSAAPTGDAVRIGRIHREFQDLLFSGCISMDDLIEISEGLFGREDIFNKAGIEDFVVDIYHEFSKFDQRQIDRLVSALVRGVSKFSRSEFCLVTADLIARKLNVNVASNLLEMMRDTGGDASRDAADVGLDILSHRSGN